MVNALTAIILTLNEERHIARCLTSLQGIASRVVVVDSLSTDGTVAAAAALGATVLSNPWVNYATQFNWALDNAPIDSDWCLRIDADEFLSDALRRDIRDQLLDRRPPTSITGFYVNRAIYFSGRRIRWGGCYPVRMLRLFRRDIGRCEKRWMDEHIALRYGATANLSGDLVDDNLNNIGWWTAKHNAYATREAIDLLVAFQATKLSTPLSLRSSEGRKRFLKERIYSRLPTGLRAGLYFLYRYVLLWGFLDGRAGFMFHFLQGFWYRLLVDAKVTEIQSRAVASHTSWQETVFREYGHRVE